MIYEDLQILGELIYRWEKHRNILKYLESTQVSNTLPLWFSTTNTTDHFYIDLQRSGHEEQYAERLKELTNIWDL